VLRGSPLPLFVCLLLPKQCVCVSVTAQTMCLCVCYYPNNVFVCLLSFSSGRIDEEAVGD